MSKLLKIFIFFLSAGLFASQAQNYGLGGDTTGRVSGVTAETDNPYAALYNPALIPSQNLALFSFSTSQAKVNYSMLPSSNITLWSLGYTYPFSLAPLLNRRAGLGITLSGPYNKIRSFVSQKPDDFYSLRYGNSDSQFKGTVALSSEVIPETLSIGAGVSFFLSGAGAAEANVQENNPTGRMALDVGLNSALVAGILNTYGDYAIGLTYHQELNPRFVQSFDGKADINGSTFHQPLLVSSSLYYEPHTIELEIQKNFNTWKLAVGLDYQIWSGYEPPILVTTVQDADGNFHTTQIPVSHYRNTLNPRISAEVPILERRIFLAAGYEYRPTPVADLSGPGNALDSDTHIVGVSIQHEIIPGELFPWPVRWGLFGQYHRLTSRGIAKTDSNFSGNAYTYGISLCVGL